jgi:hypothetical protein
VLLVLARFWDFVKLLNVEQTQLYGQLFRNNAEIERKNLPPSLKIGTRNVVIQVRGDTVSPANIAQIAFEY